MLAKHLEGKTLICRASWSQGRDFCRTILSGARYDACNAWQGQTTLLYWRRDLVEARLTMLPLGPFSLCFRQHDSRDKEVQDLNAPAPSEHALPVSISS